MHKREPELTPVSFGRNNNQERGWQREGRRDSSGAGRQSRQDPENVFGYYFDRTQDMFELVGVLYYQIYTKGNTIAEITEYLRKYRRDV